MYDSGTDQGDDSTLTLQTVTSIVDITREHHPPHRIRRIAYYQSLFPYVECHTNTSYGALVIPTLLRPMVALALIIMMGCNDDTRSTQSSNNGTLDVQSTDTYRVDTSSAPDSASLSDTLNTLDASPSTDTTVDDTSAPPADFIWSSPGGFTKSHTLPRRANGNATPMELMNSLAPPGEQPHNLTPE